MLILLLALFIGILAYLDFQDTVASVMGVVVFICLLSIQMIALRPAYHSQDQEIAQLKQQVQDLKCQLDKQNKETVDKR